MLRIALSLLVSLAMTSGSRLVYAAESPTPEKLTKKVLGCTSPAETWDISVKAFEAGNFGTVYDLFTPAAGDEITSNCIRALEFVVPFVRVGWDDEGFHALVARYDRLYAAHAIDRNWLEKNGRPFCDVEEEDLERVVSLIRDKRQFFIDVTALNMAIRDAFGEKAWGEKARREKARSEAEAEPKEAPPPDLGKLVKVKIRGEWATGEVTTRLDDSVTIGADGKPTRYRTVTKIFRRIDGRWYVAANEGEPVDVPVQKIAEADIPFERRYSMEGGDAMSFELPGERVVSVWCERGETNPYATEYTTASGLKTDWGERPFKPIRYKREREPDGSTRRGKADSYIRPGPVTTSKSEGTSRHPLFVGPWQLDIIADINAKEDLPVAIRVEKRPEKERDKL